MLLFTWYKAHRHTYTNVRPVVTWHIAYMHTLSSYDKHAHPVVTWQKSSLETASADDRWGWSMNNLTSVITSITLSLTDWQGGIVMKQTRKSKKRPLKKFLANQGMTIAGGGKIFKKWINLQGCALSISSPSLRNVI